MRMINETIFLIRLDTMMTQDPLIIIENFSIVQWFSSISWVYKQKLLPDHLSCY